MKYILVLDNLCSGSGLGSDSSLSSSSLSLSPFADLILAKNDCSVLGFFVTGSSPKKEYKPSLNY